MTPCCRARVLFGIFSLTDTVHSDLVSSSVRNSDLKTKFQGIHRMLEREKNKERRDRVSNRRGRPAPRSFNDDGRKSAVSAQVGSSGGYLQRCKRGQSRRPSRSLELRENHS